MNKLSDLKKEYDKICNEYISRFCKKHGFNIADFYWVGEITGDAVCIGDYFFSFSDIAYDINTRQPKNMILDWHNGCLENPEKRINYYSYSIGLRFSDIKIPLKDEYFAIIDVAKKEERFCYADENKTNGLMAIFDKIPKIPKEWQNVKKVKKVKIKVLI